MHFLCGCVCDLRLRSNSVILLSRNDGGRWRSSRSRRLGLHEEVACRFSMLLECFGEREALAAEEKVAHRVPMIVLA
jgi:hypothetical protein